MPKHRSPRIELPPAHHWRATDPDPANRRRWRAETEEFRITRTDPCHPICSNFRVRSGTGRTCLVEIRDVQKREVSCERVDFHPNLPGTCEHVEALLSV
jgi:hypothetical protein